MENNLKREKFVELANARVTRTIKDIQLVGNLSNRQAYEYTDADARKIIKALEVEVAKLRDRFRSGSDRANGTFKIEE